MTISKYSANGNDFVIFHTFIKKDRSELAKKICHRQNGIGADGLIVLIPHDKVDFQGNQSNIDFEWQFYNSDGSGASMCGNGSRACAHYAFVNELAPKSMKFLTGAGVIGVDVEGNMVIHGVTNKIKVKGNIKVTKDKILATSSFKLAPADYNIKIPNLVVDKVAKEVEVSVDMSYELYTKGK